jgi:hypothetical protein
VVDSAKKDGLRIFFSSDIYEKLMVKVIWIANYLSFEPNNVIEVLAKYVYITNYLRLVVYMNNKVKLL